MDFTPAQLAAVETSCAGRDTCVVAGPGSGKTTVLVEYFRRLVESGVDPLRILAITFTEKAAANMREKLAGAFAGDAQRRGRLERAYVSTVHGFCARLLRENAIFAGIDPEFYVADERESARLQWLAVTGALDEALAEDPGGTLALMRALAAPEIAHAVLGVYDAMRAAGTAIEDLENFPVPAPGASMGQVRGLIDELRRQQPAGWTAAQRAQLDAVLECCARIAAGEPLASFACNLNKLKRGNRAYEIVRALREAIPEAQRIELTAHHAPHRRALVNLIARFDRAYRASKRQSGALDYADLEEFAVELLERNPDVRARIQGQFDQVLMDEFQDTNGEQARLLELVRPPGRFYAVGDLNQSIYGFRHAQPAVFTNYRDRVNATRGRLADLRENFRSRPEILRAVETVLHGEPGIQPRPLVAEKEFAPKTEPCVEVLAGAGDDASAIETELVARRIVELAGTLTVRGRKAEFRDFAVLVRNSEVLADFTAAFDAAGIPYLVNRGKGFYETREVVDLTHLLRVLVNPRDEISMAAVLRSPFVDASDEALLRLKQSGNLGGALRRLAEEQRAAFEPADWERLRRFQEQLARWRADADYLSFDRLLLRAVEEAGYPWDANPRAAANIEKFLAQARDASARQSLGEFVQDLEAIRASNPREPEAPPEDSVNAVAVMTVHAAKGLEFPVVFVAALHKGCDTSLGCLSFSPDLGLGARWRNPVSGEAHDDLFQSAIRKQRVIAEGDESSRLFYVAMTRAEEHLVLSLAGARNWGKTLAERLALDIATPRDEIITSRSPSGETWRLRLLCSDSAPERLARPVFETAPTGVEAVARPAARGQHDSNANVTSVNTFANCPRRYYLSYYLGREGRATGGANGDGDNAGAADFGRQVHALLAGETVETPDPEALELAARFASSEMGRAARAASRVGRETDFLISVNDLVLRGQIDLWYEARGKLVLADYKTDRVTAAEAADRAEGYAVQLRLYALALAGLAGRLPDRAFLYFLRPDAAVPVDVSPIAVAGAEGVVRDFREAQSTLSFPLREGPHCRACPHFRGQCPAPTGA